MACTGRPHVKTRHVLTVLPSVAVFLVAVMFPVATADAASTTRHVKPTGYDIKIIGGTPYPNLNCSKTYPCKTIKWAVEVVAQNGDTVKVAAGTYVENVTISGNITVKGAGSGSTIVDGASAGTVFTVASGSHAAVKSLRIQHGKASQGGGVYVSGGGTLTLAAVKVTNNQAGAGGGINNYGTISLTKVTISDNTATSNAGGGLENPGTAVLDRTNVYGNHGINGAAIDNGGSLTVTNSAIHDNSTPDGYPGIYSTGLSLHLTNVTISGNTTGSSVHQGGAIFQTTGDVTLNYVTIAGNTNASYGAIYAQGGSVAVSNSIIYGNGSNAQCGTASLSTFEDGGYNVVADSSCGYWPGHGTIVANPQLKALANNGGFTPTLALKASSPAVDLVPKARCVPKDQRGVARPQDGNGDGKLACDAGAYELK
jgi:hypothetical protein